MAPMQTTMIRASMTAYSTAVGPSSALRKFTTNCPRLRIAYSPSRRFKTKKLFTVHEKYCEQFSAANRFRGARDCSRAAGAGSAVQRHVAERLIRAAAQCRNGADADDDT